MGHQAFVKVFQTNGFLLAPLCSGKAKQRLVMLKAVVKMGGFRRPQSASSTRSKALRPSSVRHPRRRVLGAGCPCLTHASTCTRRRLVVIPNPSAATTATSPTRAIW